MDGKEFLKVIMILIVFAGMGPALGVAIKNKPKAQDVVFAVMVFMSINGLFAPGNWGLTLQSIEFYRGHAKGFHFYFNHALAIALVVAAVLENKELLKRWPPGICAYLLYLIASSLSYVNAEDKTLHLMAMHKMFFAVWILLGSFAYLKDKRRILFFFRTMAFTMMWEVVMVLKSKYIDGQYQAKGTFEHQNALAMYTNMIAMSFLALGLGPDHPRNKWFMVAYICCAMIIVSALSRAAMVVFGGGTAVVIFLSLFQKPTLQRMIFVGGLCGVGFIGALAAVDTIVSRFGDQGNTASEEYRMVLNEAAKAMVNDHPLGIGWNNYALVINAPYPYAEFVWDWMRDRNHAVDENRVNSCVESHYYLLIAENGYIGFYTYFLFIGASLIRNIRCFITLKDAYMKAVCLGILMGCSMNYFQSQWERILTQPRNYMLWFFLLAITARLEIVRRNRKNAKFMAQFNGTGEPVGDVESPKPQKKIQEEILIT